MCVRVCVCVHANVCVFMFVYTYVFIKGRNRVTCLYIGRCFKDLLSGDSIKIGTRNPAHRMTAGLVSASESHFTGTLEVSRQRL